MTQLFGWIKAAIPLSDYRPDARLRAGLGEHWQNTPADSVVSAAVFSSSGSQPCDCHHEADIQAATTGWLRWDDNALSKIQATGGSARSLIAAYRKYGKDLVRHQRGHFSWALTDSRRNFAMLAIDRTGTQSLCYATTPGGGLVFGSTTTAVINHPAIDGGISRQALFNYLYFHVIPSPDSIYSAVRKLEPAQVLFFDDGKLTLDYYWNPEFTDYHASTSSEALQQELRQRLFDAVKNTEPDERTGAFLSGGLDSSTVAGMLARVNNGQRATPTYSIGFDQQGYDEIEYAHIAADHFGTRQTDYYVTPDDIFDSIIDIASAYDEPFGNSSAIPALFCARLAKQNGTDILLAGDGGDELFAGNERYAKQKIFEIYTKIPAAARRHFLEPLFLDSSLASRLPLVRKLQSYIQQASIDMPARMQSYNFMKRTPLDSMLDPGFMEQIDSGHPDELLADVYQRARSDDIVNRMLYLDWKITLADNDLRKVNRMCELASVTVKYPMLDDELLDFSTRVPAPLKLKGNRLRYFYKQGMRGFLPEQIINKPKHGFGLPFGEWLKNSEKLQDLIYSSLSDLGRRDFIRQDFLNNLIDEHRGGHAYYYGTMVWILAMLELWLREHKKNIH